MSKLQLRGVLTAAILTLFLLGCGLPTLPIPNLITDFIATRTSAPTQTATPAVTAPPDATSTPDAISTQGVQAQTLAARLRSTGTAAAQQPNNTPTSTATTPAPVTRTSTPTPTTPLSLTPTPTRTLTLTPVPPPTFYNIVNLHTQKCLTAPYSDADNAPVGDSTCTLDPSQQWQLVPMGNGYSEIVAQHNGKCLDIKDKHAEDGFPVVQAACVGNGSQLWRLQSFGSYADVMAQSKAAKHAAPPIAQGTYYQIIAQISGKCIDLDGWSHDDGASLLYYGCQGSDNDNQLWALK